METSDAVQLDAAAVLQAQLEREAIHAMLTALGIPQDVLPAAMAYYESSACGKNLEALRREFHRRSVNKCLLLTQTAKPQLEYFRACLEGNTAARGNEEDVTPDVDPTAVPIASYLLVGGMVSTDKLFQASGLTPGVDYDTTVRLFDGPSYDAVEAHVAGDRPLQAFLATHLLANGYKEVVGLVTGSDGSVPLCDGVNAALGVDDFLTNDPRDAFVREARRDKVMMHKAVEQYAAAAAAASSFSSSFSLAAGSLAVAPSATEPPMLPMLFIRSVAATSFPDATAKIAAAQLQFPLICKPATGAGSEFVHYCLTLDDVETAFRVTAGLTTTQHTSTASMCVQEYIEGDEYVVNVVSYHGIHIVTDCWHSVKNPMQVRSDRLRASQRRTPGGGDPAPRPELDTITIIYDRLTFIPNLDAEPPGSHVRAIAAYTLRCLDALQVRNGCSHSELRYDATRGGPCLIEMNPRMQGDVPRATTFVGYDQVSLYCYLIRIGKERLEAAERSGSLGKYWPPPIKAAAAGGGSQPLPPSDQGSIRIPQFYTALPCLEGEGDGRDDRTALVIFLLTKDDGVVCDWGRQFIATQLPTFSRFTRSLMREPQPGVVNVCHKTTDIFSCIGAVILIGSRAAVERDAAVVRSMENQRVSSAGALPLFVRARQMRQQWRAACATYAAVEATAHRGARGLATRPSRDRDAGDSEEEASEEDASAADEDDEVARASQLVWQTERAQQWHVELALDAFRRLVPPPLFVSTVEWEALRDSGCGKVCGASWWLTGEHLPPAADS